MQEIAEGLTGFLSKLRADVMRLEESSEATASTSSLISRVSTELVQNSETTAMASDKILGAASEVSEQIEVAARCTGEFQSSTQEIAEQTAMAAQKASEGSALAREAREKVKTLMDCSREVESITETINTIAEQTNLLALNATIEAARAGESGKGFAVVAHEVKELASETGDATQSIADQTERIRLEAEIVAEFIQKMVDGVGQIDDAQTAIAAAMQEQTAVANDVVGAVESALQSSVLVVGEAQAVARESEASKESSRAADTASCDLHAVVNDLNDIVQGFDVKTD